MSSPTFDLPEHCPIEVDANGNGPADGIDVDHTACWCGQDAYPCPLEAVQPAATAIAHDAPGKRAASLPGCRPSWRRWGPHSNGNLAIVRPTKRGAHLPVVIHQLIGGKHWSLAVVVTGTYMLDESPGGPTSL